MTTATKGAHESPAHEAQADAHHDHPTDKTYWAVGGALGLLTALEVSTYFITDDPYSHDLAPLLIGSLLLMMMVKFAVIGAYFMHLKFDNPIFRRLFVAGLVLAVVVYLVVMSTFRYFSGGYEGALGL